MRVPKRSCTATKVAATTKSVKANAIDYVDGSWERRSEIMPLPLVFADRLKLITDSCECSFTTLSKAVGVNPGVLAKAARVSKQNGNIVTITGTTIYALRELTRVDLNWLISGEGTPDIRLTAEAKARITAAALQPHPKGKKLKRKGGLTRRPTLTPTASAKYPTPAK